MLSVNLSTHAMEMSGFALNILILITIFFWGAWGIIDKKALESGSPRDVFLILLLCDIPLVPLAAAIAHASGQSLEANATMLFWTAMSAITMTASSVVYLMALEKSEASYVLGITASYPLMAQLTAVFFLSEPLVPVRFAGSILIVAGVTAVGFSARGNTGSGSGNKRSWLLTGCAVASTFLWGLYGLFDKKAVLVAHPTVVFFWQCLFCALLVIPTVLLFRKVGHRPQLANKRTWLFSSLSAACVSLAALTYLWALSAGSASYVITITGCYPLVMYGLAVLFLKERINSTRLLGILLIVAGGIVVQLAQSL